MNKTKKIVAFAVGVVMAGTVAMSVSACGGDSGSSKKLVDPSTDASGKLTYAAGTTISTSIGYNSSSTGMKYTTDNAIVGKSLMGKTWATGDLKPAWAELQSQLNVTFNDVWSYTSDTGSSSNNLNTAKTILGMSNVDVFTVSLTKANEEAISNGTLLNLADYLDYMPNYKAFLESSPVIQMSLLASSEGDMYVAPYFDGNDDIEKFVLMRKDIVEDILINTLPTSGDSTFKVQGAKNKNYTSTSVEAFMGSTNYSIATTDPASLETVDGAFGNDATSVSDDSTVDVTVNYTAALTAAKTTNSELNAALLAAYANLDVSTLTSGNIIDLQNAVINGTNGEVSGTALINILRAYIDVAYTDAEGNAFYTSSNGLNRAGVFNSACAAWDVDLYVALGRCYVSSGSMFVKISTPDSTKPTYLVSGRTNDDQRQSDLYSLAGELYGVRGLESRYNYTYIKEDGKVADARANAATWDAMDALSKLEDEGLMNTEIAGGDYSTGLGYSSLSLHDYAQTQTKNTGFTSYTADECNFAPILTPVSYWDTDDDGEAETYMRFTESWRSVKTEGVAVSKNVAYDADKLAAVLAFIDYIYSSDGQILMTYGPQSTNGNSNPNGLWYATEATGVSLASVVDSTKTIAATNYADAQYTVSDAYKGQYFVYKGKVYTGTYYNGRQIPTMTDENLEVFGRAASEGGGAYNFTNHARQNLGSCFPIGNKDQGFEYQCTSPSGLAGSDIVNVALNNGTIKHQYQTIDSDNYWYTLVPTSFPYDSMTTNALSTGQLQYISGLGGNTTTLYCVASKQNANLLLKVGFYGYSTTNLSLNNQTIDITNASTIIAANNTMGLASLITYKQTAWQSLLSWYASASSAS